MSIFSFIESLIGTYSDRQIKKIKPIVEQINIIYPTLADKSIEDLQARTAAFKDMIRTRSKKYENSIQDQELTEKELRKKVTEYENSILDEILPEAFAMVKDVCRRLVGDSWNAAGYNVEWNMIPYDVQLIGGIALHQGKISEMKTGEGKTLVATMPIFLNALTGRGVHVVTVNDYLAKRDSEWMGRIYNELGLSYGCITNDMAPDQRKEVYSRDIIYG